MLRNMYLENPIKSRLQLPENILVCSVLSKVNIGAEKYSDKMQKSQLIRCIVRTSWLFYIIYRS